MGFYFTPWVSDMLDLSGGCGSWNLSMNQGLAHLQATSYMNSCWTCGCGFSPYSSMGNGLEYLLDPSFAMWQTANGISSSNNLWGNNFGNFGNFFNPWQSNQTTPNNNKKKDDTPEERASKYDFNTLEELMNDYAKSIGGSAGDNLKDEIKNIKNDKDKSWKEKLDALKALYDRTLDKNSDKFKEFILKNNKLKLSVGINRDKFLTDLIRKSGYDYLIRGLKDDEKDYKISDMKDNFDRLCEADGNASALESVTSDNVLEVISSYNSNYVGGIAKDFVKGYDNISSNAKGKEAKNSIKTRQNTAVESLEHLIEALKTRANGIMDSLTSDAQTNLKTSIDNLQKCIKTDKEGQKSLDSKSFVDAFNKLYAQVRLAEVQKIELELDNMYKDMSNKKISSVVQLSKTTKEDLAKEIYNSTDTSNVDSLVDKIECEKPKDVEDVTLSGTHNNGSVQNEEEQEENEFEKAGLIGKTGDKLSDGTIVYESKDAKIGLPVGAPCVLEGDGVTELNHQQSIEYGILKEKVGELGHLDQEEKLALYLSYEDIGKLTAGVFYVVDKDNGIVRTISDVEYKAYLNAIGEEDAVELLINLGTIDEAKTGTTLRTAEIDGNEYQLYICKESDSRINLEKGKTYYIKDGEFIKYNV